MTYQRRSPRLQGYDYTQEGAYFVTVCTFERYELFGEIVDETMELNSLGEIAHSRWLEIPQHFPNVELDLFVVMPNHVHGIVLIVDHLSGEDESMRQSRTRHASSLQKPIASNHRLIGAKAGSVGAVLGSYKAAVTRDINKLLEVRTPRVWQTRYHDHIIRSDRELQQIKRMLQPIPHVGNKIDFSFGLIQIPDDDETMFSVGTRHASSLFPNEGPWNRKTRFLPENG